MIRKTPRTIGEYLVPRRLTAEQLALQKDEVEYLKNGLRDGVKELAELWDGHKLIGEPKMFQRFLGPQ